MEENRKVLIRYAVTIAAGGVMALIIMLTKHLFSQTNTLTIYHILTDSFFVSGVLLTCFGALVVATNEGQFDIIIFGFRKFFDMLRKKEHQVVKETFYDFRVSRAHRKNGFWHLVFVGLFYILVSLLFLYLWYSLQ